MFKKLAKYLTIILTTVLISSFLVIQDEDYFENQWHKVRAFVEKGQPKSALKIVDEIFKVSKSENNTSQTIKSLIYRVSLKSTYEENHILEAINIFKGELDNSSLYEKHILQSLIAELYHSYYISNRWQINKRKIIPDNKNEDVSTWDAVKLNREIEKYYNASLKNGKQVDQLNLNDFDAILMEGDSSNFDLWPTLFDLLANRALNYYISADADFTEFASPNKTDNSNYLLPVSKFINLKINPKKSAQAKALNLFQRLLAIHIKQNNTDALIDLDLRRLKYAYENSSQTNELENKYIEALTLLSKKYSNHPVYASITAGLASQYFNQGNSYSPEFNKDTKYNLVIADSICKVVIKKYPNVSGSNICRNLTGTINQIDFRFDMPVANMPEKPILSFVQFKNIDKLYFKIVQGDPFANKNKNDRKSYLLKELMQKEIVSWEQKLPKTTDHRMHSVEVKIPKLNPGFYVIFASNNPSFSTDETVKFKTIWITNLSYISNNNEMAGCTDLFTMNRETGKTIGDVKITLYLREYENRSRTYNIREAGQIVSDKNGYAKIESSSGNNYGTYLLMFEKDGNKLFSENYLHFSRHIESTKPNVKTYLFTDRAVYRPGQTVYFKGIVVEELGGEVTLVTGQDTDIVFVNASRKKIKTSNFTTNQDGSFNGSFIIPTGGLNGQMLIRCSTGNVTFLVENYKLPTFEIVFDSLVGQPKLDEGVIVSGKAIGYAGNFVDGAEVNYRVTRKAVFPVPYFRNRSWFPPDISREIDITNGKTTTTADGVFKFQFNAIPDQRVPINSDIVFNYEISAEITDITGEVQSANTNVRVGNKSAIIEFKIPEVIEQNKTGNLSVTAKNINGTSVSINTTISLYKLTTPIRLLNKRLWGEPDFFTIPKEKFKEEFPHAVYKNEDDKNTWQKDKISDLSIVIKGITKLPVGFFSELAPGEYMIIAAGKDKYGDTIENQHFFTLYSSTGKVIPGNIINWSALSENKAEPGETIKLIIGSAAKKSQIMYEIVNGKEIIERNWITISRGQKIIEIPVKESYRGNFSINLTMIRFNRLYSKKMIVTVPFSNKEIDIELETFRKYLTPGAKEEWTVTLSGSEGQKLSSALLAGMYDASLDIFSTNTWQMNLYHNKQQTSKWRSNQFSNSSSSALFTPELKYYRINPVKYPAINWFDYQFSGHNYIIYNQMDGGMREIPSLGKTAHIDGIVVDKDITVTGEDVSIVTEQKEDKIDPIIPLRNNFNETAFFYPNLITDSSGKVKFKFTTPDALTEWKVRMLAYTNDLKTGTFESNIKSQKQLMIIPNVPRFVRQGDTLIFTAKVINFTDKEIVADANIEFFDALSMKPMSLHITGKTISQSILPKQSAQVSWTISIPENISMIGYKITAKSGSFSDGEERMFPVLTNRMLITNTLPMNVSASDTANFTFEGLSDPDKLSPTLKNYRYTVEFTSNPAWYAVQAIPYISEPRNKSNTALFNSYFANSLSSYIVNSNPKIKSVFESWKHLTPDAVLSNLEKNQSLKNTLITSTPWILDAENESEQKRRIGILTNVNHMANQKETVIDKLLKSQLPSGAWPWFKGMREDRHTTQTIVIGMAKLHHKGIMDLSSNNKRFQMVRKAVSWLDTKIVEDFTDLKKRNAKSMKNYHIYYSQIQYLYLRALLADVIPIPEKSQKAINYYVDQEKKYWLKQSNYLQGMIAISLNTFGHRNESEAIIRSLKERSLYSDEMGMYWRENAGWNWYQAPIETQAMMIETMAELDNNPSIIEQLKVWLLKQKQTQHWKTSSATAEAIYALLMFGNSDLENSNLVDITVGNLKIDVEGNPDIQTEAGTGFFSTSWSGDEITKDLSNISVINTNNNIAWGAAYWQFFEDIDKVEPHDSPLSVEKRIFTEKLTDGGPKLVAVEPGQILKTGDKVVVQLTISTDRNMEYIQLTDMRATTFEPVSPISGYTYEGGLWFYKNITDVSTDFFLRYLQKGTYVLEYPLYVTQKGDFTNGIATIQSMYAPEFAAHSAGNRVSVGE